MLLFRITQEYPEELQEFIDKLRSQHGEALDILAFFGFLKRPEKDGDPWKRREGEPKPPDFEKVLRTFSPDQLQLARAFQESTLLIPDQVP